MLAIPTPFPNQGATAYLRPCGSEVRIIQRRNDGDCTIAIAGRFKSASSTRTVPLADLAESVEEAQAPISAPAKRARRQKAA